MAVRAAPVAAPRPAMPGKAFVPTSERGMEGVFAQTLIPENTMLTGNARPDSDARSLIREVHEARQTPDGWESFLERHRRRPGVNPQHLEDRLGELRDVQVEGVENTTPTENGKTLEEIGRERARLTQAYSQKGYDGVRGEDQRALLQLARERVLADDDFHDQYLLIEESDARNHTHHAKDFLEQILRDPTTREAAERNLMGVTEGDRNKVKETVEPERNRLNSAHQQKKAAYEELAAAKKALQEAEELNKRYENGDLQQQLSNAEQMGTPEVMDDRLTELQRSIPTSIAQIAKLQSLLDQLPPENTTSPDITANTRRSELERQLGEARSRLAERRTLAQKTSEARAKQRLLTQERDGLPKKIEDLKTRNDKANEGVTAADKEIEDSKTAVKEAQDKRRKEQKENLLGGINESLNGAVDEWLLNYQNRQIDRLGQVLKRREAINRVVLGEQITTEFPSLFTSRWETVTRAEHIITEIKGVKQRFLPPGKEQKGPNTNNILSDFDRFILGGSVDGVIKDMLQPGDPRLNDPTFMEHARQAVIDDLVRRRDEVSGMKPKGFKDPIPEISDAQWEVMRNGRWVPKQAEYAAKVNPEFAAKVQEAMGAPMEEVAKDPAKVQELQEKFRLDPMLIITMFAMGGSLLNQPQEQRQAA